MRHLQHRLRPRRTRCSPKSWPSAGARSFTTPTAIAPVTEAAKAHDILPGRADDARAHEPRHPLVRRGTAWCASSRWYRSHGPMRAASRALLRALVPRSASEAKTLSMKVSFCVSVKGISFAQGADAGGTVRGTSSGG